nr:trehalase family glycosidase [Vagococcus allomyrinae]
MSDHGLPYYTHGNDSGWDNASIFHQGLPVISPDLSGYLIQQMDILGRWAKQLGRSDDSERWQQLADQLTEQLLKVLYDGDHFMARSYRTGEPIEESHSLLLCLPLVISYRLPESLVTRLIQRIITQFEGPFGLQTEAKDSPHYQVDGYWLGPIWAPASFIFFDAFRRSGHLEIAKRLAQKYCQLANEHGMAENYNPETGAGNDDLAFTWTSSVFLLLGNYLKELENG